MEISHGYSDFPNHQGAESWLTDQPPATWSESHHTTNVGFSIAGYLAMRLPLKCRDPGRRCLPRTRQYKPVSESAVDDCNETRQKDMRGHRKSPWRFHSIVSDAPFLSSPPLSLESLAPQLPAAPFSIAQLVSTHQTSFTTTDLTEPRCNSSGQKRWTAQIHKSGHLINVKRRVADPCCVSTLAKYAPLETPVPLSSVPSHRATW